MASVRLRFFVLGSLLLHVALLLLPVREWRFSGAAEHSGAAEQFARKPALQVLLSSPSNKILRVLPESMRVVPPHFTHGSAREEVREKEKESELGFSAVFDYQAPEIVSEVPHVISNLKTSGFMVVRLAIDDVGQVESADIVYSNMPFEVSGKLLLLFSQARFRPARYGGKAVADSILLQVDVD